MSDTNSDVAGSVSVKKSKLEAALKPVDELECAPMSVSIILVDPNASGGVAIVECEGSEYALPLVGHEASSLAFVQSGCAQYAHIPTVHQTLARQNEDRGFKLACLTLEAKEGDILYMRLKWTNAERGLSFYHVMTVGGGLIMRALSEDVELKIVRRVLDALDPMDDWHAEDDHYTD
jgi:hypothetical protein